MINRKTSLFLILLGMCLIIGLSAGEDWLVGGYVSSFNPHDDPSLYGLKRWLDYPYPAYSPPYGVYPPYPSYYYFSPGWTPLYGVGWQAYNANWARTLEYAQTKSSIRVHPVPAVSTTPTATTAAPSSATTPAPTAATTATTTYYTPKYESTAPLATSSTAPVTAPASSAATASPAPTTGDSTAIIVSEKMRGYQVFLDGVYIGTEGTGGDALDGRFSFKVVGNRNHSVRIYDGQLNYPKIMFFEPGATKIIYVEPGTAIYV